MAVVARMVASLEAETSQFHSRMTAAEAQMNKWTGSTVAGTRGMRVLNNSIQQLAFQAAGIPGPVGKAASAIGMLGAGSAVTLGAVAGIGAIATAYKLASAEAESLKASTDKLNASYRDILAGGRPLVALQERIATAVEAQTKAQDELDRLHRTVAPSVGVMGKLGFGGMTVGTAGEIALAQNNLDAASRVVNALRSLRPDMVKAAEDMAMAAKLIAIQMEQVQIALERGGVFQALRRSFAAPAFGVSSGGALGLGGLTTATFDNIRRNVPRFVAPDVETYEPHYDKLLQNLRKDRSTGFSVSPEFAALSALAVAQGAQGGMGAFFGAAAAPAAMINPLAGVITGTLGTLFSLFDSKESERDRNEERRHKELIGVLHEGPARITQIFEGDPAASLYENRRQERLGGEARNGGL